MATTTQYIYELTTSWIHSVGDVIFMANAAGVTDNGRIITGDTWDLTGNYMTYALGVQADNKEITIGGNYLKNSDGSDNTSTYSMYWLPTSDSRLPGYSNVMPQNVNVMYRGYNIRDDVATIKINENGVLHLSAQTGAYAADTYYGNVKKIDDDIRLVGQNFAAYQYNQDSFIPAEITANMDNNTVSVIEAGGTLTIGGDLSGGITADANSYFHGFVNASTTPVYVETCVDANNRAYGIRSANLVINNNMRAFFEVTSDAIFKTVFTNTASNNTMTAIGIYASGNVTMGNGRWAGSITATASNTNTYNPFGGSQLGTISALCQDLQPIGTSTPTLTSATVTGNKLAAIGIRADGTLTIDEMIGGNWSSGYNFKSEANNLTLEASANGGTGAATITMTGNEVKAYNIETGSLVMGNVSSDVKMIATASNNTLSATFLGGTTRTLTIGANLFQAISIKAGSFSVRDFQGDLEAEASNNVFIYQSASAVTHSSCGASVGGIVVTSALTAANNFGGTITIKSTSNTLGSGFYFAEAYGIKAGSFTVTGRIDTDIEVTISGNNGLRYANNAIGINISGNLTADAFAGSISVISDNSAAVGMNVYGQISSGLTGDAFDITGTISNCYVGVAALGQMNLRVSGSISTSGYAILAEHYLNFATNVYTVTLTHPNDKVELAAGAYINGDIDLSGGDNTTVINTKARMDGMLLATQGQMNIEFVLDGSAQSNAVVNTALYSTTGDISLTSTTMVTVNLNYAQGGDVYTLFNYTNSSGTDIANYWFPGREVAFVYKSYAERVTLDANRQASLTFADGATATFWYENNQIKVKVDNVVNPAAYNAQSTFQFDAEKNTFTINWIAAGSTIAYDLEYTVYDSQGNAYGGSIVARVNGSTTSYVVKGINDGDRVEWKIRQDLNGTGGNVSGWSSTYNQTTSPVPPGTTVDMSSANTFVNNASDPTSSAVTAPTVRVSWGDPEHDNPIQNYVVQYFFRESQITMADMDLQGNTIEEKIASAFASGKYSVYEKTVTSQEAILSGMTNQTFVYWQVKAVDVFSNESDYRLGTNFQTFLVEDKTKPVFTDADVTAVYDYSDPTKVNISVTFNWNEAFDNQSGVSYYLIEYKEAGQTWDQATRAIIRYGDYQPSNGYQYTYNITVNGSLHDYRMSAVDYVGNQSDYAKNDSFGDGNAPIFTTASVNYTYDLSVPSQPKMNTTFSWNPATDDESGVKYYLLEYKVKGADWSTATQVTVNHDSSQSQYSYQTVLNSGEYEYRVSAYDFVGNQSEYRGNEEFGGDDITPPTGSFTNMGTPTITVTYGTREVMNKYGVYETERYVTSAIVDFDWTDTYQDDSGVLYWVQFSDSATFGTSKTYTFQSFAELGSSFFMGNNQVSRPVGIFADMDTVYWRVMATDTAGNDTGVWSSTNSFKFVDPDGGGKITHQNPPAKPYNLTITQHRENEVYTGNVTITFDVANTDLGIGYIEDVFTSKDGESFTNRYGLGEVTPDDPTSRISDYSHIYGPESFTKDGTYKWTVNVYSMKGSKISSDSVTFVVDTTRPTTVSITSAAPLAVDAKDAYIAWNTSTDYFGIAGYEVYYRATGIGAEWNRTSQALITGTNTLISGLIDGTYDVVVYARDKNNNRSLVSSTKNFTIDSKTDLADSAAYSLSYDQVKDAQGYVSNSVGLGDAADFFYFLTPNSGDITISVSNIRAINSSKAGSIDITLYAYDPAATDRLRIVKEYKNIKSNQVYSLLVEVEKSGGYYVGITASNNDVLTDYKLKFEYSQFNSNNEDDNWQSLNTNKYSMAYGAKFNDWVGFGDKTDYRKLSFTSPGAYDFTISNVTNPLKLTVYELNEKTGKLKKVKSISVMPGKNLPVTSKTIAGLLLDSSKQYYVSVEASQDKKGKNSNYTLEFSGTQFSKANQAKDDVWSDPQTPTLAYRSNITGEWVGFGDVLDYRKLSVNYSGSYNFTISGIQNKVKLTVYELNANTGKLKRVKSISVSDKQGAATISDVLIDKTKSYYVCVQATGAKKGQNSNYNLNFNTGTEFNNVYNNLKNNNWGDSQVGTMNMQTGIQGEWVGFGDAVDWFKFDVATAGQYGFDLQLGVDKAAKMTIYSVQADGKLKKVGLDKLGYAEMATGSYALEITSADKGKGKKNTGYNLLVDTSLV